ncbi:MAG TPA: cyclase family protein [Terracidiphilus sp.]|jgi:kynurenine formamidase|nr:cyclase family protein [Terracidiphilus sp.]
MKTLAAAMSRQQFDRLFARVSNWGVWGSEDQRGTLNYITLLTIQHAASLVKTGQSVSMAIPINKSAGPDNPRAVAHYMSMLFEVDKSFGEPGFSLDFFGSEIHGDCHTHIDALCHIAYEGKMYNGKPTSMVTSRGPKIMDITTYANGVIGRGVLLDIPRLRGVKWLEPGEAVTRKELEECERAQGVSLGEGDIFVFRTGHHRRRLELGPWNNGYDGEGKAGLHSDTIPFMHERKVAAFFPDGDGETVPSNVEGVAYPIHALQIGAMGMICADSLNLEDVSAICSEERRWEFMVVAAPLRLPGGTGSLFNPLAIF